MKMKIDMMSVWDIIHDLENQDSPEVASALKEIKDIFGPLIEQSENCKCPPVYDIEVKDDTFDGAADDKPDNGIDWEQRRYELVRSIYAAHMQSNPNYNRQSSQAMRGLLIGIMRQADFIIEALKQDDLTQWDASLY